MKIIVLGYNNESYSFLYDKEKRKTISMEVIKLAKINFRLVMWKK